MQFQNISTLLKGLEFPETGDSVTLKNLKKCMKISREQVSNEIFNSKAEKMDS